MSPSPVESCCATGRALHKACENCSQCCIPGPPKYVKQWPLGHFLAQMTQRPLFYILWGSTSQSSIRTWILYDPI